MGIPCPDVKCCGPPCVSRNTLHPAAHRPFFHEGSDNNWSYFSSDTHPFFSTKSMTMPAMFFPIHHLIPSMYPFSSGNPTWFAGKTPRFIDDFPSYKPLFIDFIVILSHVRWFSHICSRHFPAIKLNFSPFSRIPPGFPVYPPKNLGEI